MQTDIEAHAAPFLPANQIIPLPFFFSFFKPTGSLLYFSSFNLGTFLYMRNTVTHFVLLFEVTVYEFSHAATTNCYKCIPDHLVL